MKTQEQLNLVDSITTVQESFGRITRLLREYADKIEKRISDVGQCNSRMVSRVDRASWIVNEIENMQRNINLSGLVREIGELGAAEAVVKKMNQETIV